MNSFAQSLTSPYTGKNMTTSPSYVEDVLRTMLNDQSDHVYAKFSESYMKYRRVVVEWMVDVAEYFNLHLTTTHAAIAYLDRLQPNEKYSRFEWQMMAICCLIISSKYNECEEHVPPLHKLEEITQQAMSNECVLNYELWALKRMGWKLNARTPMAFLDSYLYLARRQPDAQLPHMSCFFSSDFEASLQRMATKCMVDHSFKALPASAIAAGIIYFTRETSFCEPVWTSALSRLTGHDAPTSKSVQQVLKLLDVMMDNEALAMQDLLDTQPADSSVEESAEGIADVMAAMRIEDNSVDSYDGDACSALDSTADESYDTAQDSENVRPAVRALTSAATKVMEMFSSAPKAKQAFNVVTPATTAKTIGGEGAPGKNEISPVSIAGFDL